MSENEFKIETFIEYLEYLLMHYTKRYQATKFKESKERYIIKMEVIENMLEAAKFIVERGKSDA
jgi:hypothetical protein